MAIIIPRNCIEAIANDHENCTWKSLARDRKTLVAAIKEFRSEYKCVLKQAKDAVEHYISYGNDITFLVSDTEAYRLPDGILEIRKNGADGYVVVYRANPKVISEGTAITHEQAVQDAINWISKQYSFAGATA